MRTLLSETTWHRSMAQVKPPSIYPHLHVSIGQPESSGARLVRWPSRDIGIANIVWCMAYTSELDGYPTYVRTGTWGGYFELFYSSRASLGGFVVKHRGG